MLRILSFGKESEINAALSFLRLTAVFDQVCGEHPQRDHQSTGSFRGCEYRCERVDSFPSQSPSA